MNPYLRGLSVILCVIVVSPVAFGQGFSSSVTVPYRIIPNITYLTANNFDANTASSLNE